jgi:hypothetical protein
MQRQKERLDRALEKPLRYRLVDKVNDTIKQRAGFLHQALRHTADLGETTQGLTRRLQRLSERLGRRRR